MTYEMKLQEMQDFGYNKGKTDGNFVPPTAPHKGAAHGTSKNNVPYLVPATAPHKDATHGTSQK